MSSITLTPRGRVVKTVFILLCLMIAFFLAFVFISWLGNVVTGNSSTVPSPQIECVQDTVLQPDGSCAPQEN